MQLDSRKKAIHASPAIPVTVGIGLALALAQTAAAAADPSDADTEARQLFQRHYDSRHYDAAVDAGKLMVHQLIEAGKADGLAMARALTNLADAQRQSDRLDIGIANYLQAIELAETATNHLGSALIDPLLGLGRAYADSGQLAVAARTYERALHIDHVNNGPLNPEQMALLYEMSELYFSLGNFDEALAIQNICVDLARRHQPQKAMSQLPALFARAQMLARTGRLMDSQSAYRDIIRLIEDADGKESLALLPALHELADLFLYNVIEDGYDGMRQARRYLRRALRVAERHPDATVMQKANARIAMGDFLLLKTADTPSAQRHYRRAWDLLDQSSAHTEREKLFDGSVALNDVPSNHSLGFRDLINREGEHEGHVSLVFNVTSAGRPVDIRLLEAVPEGYKEEVVISRLRDLAFRPRMADGVPTGTRNLRFEVQYRFDSSVLTDHALAGAGQGE